MTRPASPLRMWAVVVVGKRSEYALAWTIRRTRYETVAAWRDGAVPSAVKKMGELLQSGRLRLARVVVQLEG